MDTLIRSHGPRVMGLLGRLLGSRQDAEDAFQETWCAIWQAMPRLRPNTDPWPFIRKAAVRKAIDLIRTRDPAPVADDSPAEPVTTRREPDVDLAGLPPLMRLTLTLYFWEGLSVREIAEQLDVPTGTVKTWMFRARQRLRDQLAELGERR